MTKLFNKLFIILIGLIIKYDRGEKVGRLITKFEFRRKRLRLPAGDAGADDQWLGLITVVW